MGEPIDRNEMLVLDRAACLDKLASARLGRVGITSGALPMVLPVLYRLDGDRILIRCPEDSALMSALDRCVVAFEVDAIGGEDEPARGWSVVVTGMARALAPDAVEVDPWSIPSHPLLPRAGRVVEIRTDRMTGREVSPPDGEPARSAPMWGTDDSTGRSVPGGT